MDAVGSDARVIRTIHGERGTAGGAIEVPACGKEVQPLVLIRNHPAPYEAVVAPPELWGRGEDLWEGFLRSMQAHHNLPQTLIDGDAHLGNWYVTAGGVMGLCNWRSDSVGQWSRDLAYALASTLDVERRRAWKRQLIRAYLDQLGERGSPGFDFADAWEMCRLRLHGAVVMWTPTYRPPLLMPDMQPAEVIEEMLRRISAAIVDLESLSS